MSNSTENFWATFIKSKKILKIQQKSFNRKDAEIRLELKMFLRFCYS